MKKAESVIEKVKEDNQLEEIVFFGGRFTDSNYYCGSDYNKYFEKKEKILQSVSVNSCRCLYVF